MKGRKIKLFVLILIVILTLIVFGKVFPKKDKVIEVEVSQVKRGEIAELISCKGKVTSPNLQEIRLNIDGVIEDVYVKEGMEVKKGEVLCTIKNPDGQELLSIKQGLRSSIMDYEVAKEKLEEARKTYDRNMEGASLDLEESKENLERYKRLYLEGAISKRELDEAEKSLKKAHLRYEEAKGNPIVKDAETQVKKAHLELEKTKKQLVSFIERIRPDDRIVLLDDIESLERELPKVYSRLEKGEIVSPIDGIIIKVDIGEGESIRKGESIKKGTEKDADFKIADLKDPIAELEVSEYDIRKVKIGQEVKITSSGLDRVLKARIIEISGEIKRDQEGKTSTISVKAKIDLAGVKLRLGSSIEGEILISQVKDILKVPIEAVLESEGGKVVYVVRDNRACVTPVEIGICGREALEIKEGLKEGEEVITIGNLDVKDGGIVRIKKGI